jgi:hypothetical protein
MPVFFADAMLRYIKLFAPFYDILDNAGAAKSILGARTSAADG